MFPSRILCIVSAVFFLASAAPAAADVVLINVFEIPKGQSERAVAAWEKARDFLKNEPGYIATSLHRSIDPKARFHLINIARWESPELFFEAIERMNEAAVFPQIEGLRINPALYRVVRTDAPDVEGAER